MEKNVEPRYYPRLSRDNGKEHGTEILLTRKQPTCNGFLWGGGFNAPKRSVCASAQSKLSLMMSYIPCMVVV